MIKEIWKKDKGSRFMAAILSGVLLVLTGMAAHAGGINTWRFPLSLFLSLAAGAYLLLRRQFGWVRNSLTLVAVPFLSMWFLQWLTCDPTQMYPKMLLLSCLFFYLFFWVLSFLLGSFRRGYCTAVILSMIVGVANYFVMEFRSTPIVPWDLLSLGTAASVADNYTYTISWRLLTILMGYVFLILAAAKMTWKMRKLRIRVLAFLCCLALLLTAGIKLQDERVRKRLGMHQIMFTPNVRYERNGFVPAFLGTLYLVNVQKPDNYSAQKAEEIAQSVRTEKEEDIKASRNGAEDGASVELPPTDACPNIIVIMDEAFSDLSVLGEFETNEDYMPFTHSLMEDYTSGHLMVSVKGGNTANTEYEFLTGDTNAFLPSGSIAYQQYVKGDLPSLATQLAQQGYSTTAIHPYRANGWERDRVYPLMGFQNFISINSFADARYIRKYVSDEAAFDKIIDVFEQGDRQKQFIFEVTMQNHGGYGEDFPNFPVTIDLLGSDDTGNNSVLATERYLSLIKETDTAFQNLIQYFQQVDEPTIIVMFGDHQPSDYITNAIARLTGYDKKASLEEYQKTFLVPFVIWDNMGLEKDTSMELSSVNYLGAYLMDRLGIPLSTYQEFLLKLKEELPVICSGAYVDSAGTYYYWSEEKNAYSETLNDYNILQYNHLADTKNRVEDIFISK